MKQNPVYKAAFAEWMKNPGSRAYVRTADVAKLIRAQLKANFPGVKFSVRSDVYSGGSSIRVYWMDGPTSDLVDRVVKVYAGSGFDGMTDYKYSKGAWLMPDGSAGSRSVEAHWGTDGETIEAQKDGAIPVRFSADFVFTNRTYSVAALERAAKSYAAKWGDELAEAIKSGDLIIAPSDYDGSAFFKNADSFKTECGEYASTVLWRVAQRRMMAA